MSGQTEIMWEEAVDIAGTDEWQEYHLGEVADIQTGPFGSQLHSADYVAAGIPSIMPTNIGRRLEISKSAISFITEADAQRLSRYLVKDGDIVYSRRGDVEKCAFITEQESGWLCGTGCLRIRFTSDIILPKFCAYYLSTDEMKGWISSHAVGTTMPNLNSGILKRLPITLPSLPEQRAIAGVLSSLDDKIDLLHQQNATLEALAETLFRQWFVEQAKEEWEDCALEDICTTIASGGTPSTRVDSYYNGEVNWYSTKELKDNFLFQSESRITDSGLNNSSAKLFPINTVVIAIYAAPTVGRLGILTNEACFNQAACGLIANSEYCSFEFLYLFLKYQRAELNAMASGSAQQNLNVGKIRAYPAFKAPSEYMNTFVGAVKPLFSKIKENSTQIRTLTTLRDTLLPKLMSGEVRVAY